MRHPKDVGGDSLAAVMFAFRLCDFAFYLPFGENSRSDLILEQGTTLRRVQCKTGRLRNGAVVFRPCSTYGHHPNPKVLKRDYQGEIDDFAVYCPELGTVYLIPIEDVPVRSQCVLRVLPPRNHQSSRVRPAARYELIRFDVI